MSLLDDLKGIDVSGIVDARSAIQAAIASPALTAALQGGAAQAALGELGTVIEGLQTGDPSVLVRPLAAGLGELHGLFSFDQLPLGRYADAIEDGVGVLTKVIQGLDGDPSKIGSAFGFSLDDLVNRAHGGAGEMLGQALGSGGGIVSLAADIDRGLGSDPSALIDVTLRALLPIPSETLGDLQTRVAGLAVSAGKVAIPAGRTQGLIDAFGRVEAAARARDAAALTTAMRGLEQVRLSTIASLRDDLTLAMAQVRKLDIAGLLSPLRRADAAMRGLNEGLLDQMTRWRELVALMRRGVEDFDPALLTTFIDKGVKEIEKFIEQTILAFIDEQVKRAVDWMRGLFRHVPIVALRAELTAFFHGVTLAIAKADVGRYAREARAFLDDLQALISPEALRAQVQQALGAAGEAIDGALDGVIEKLGDVKAAVEAVADQAAAVIGRIVPGLTAFNAAVVEIEAGAADVGLEAASQKVVEQLEILREAAEALLTESPLPDAMKDQVAQVVEFVRGIDLDAAFEPVRRAAAELALPDELAASVDVGLAEAAKVIDNLIPARLVEGIEADVTLALDQIASFDPSKLLPDLSGFLGQAADAVAKLAPSAELAAEVHAPFQKLLDLIDLAQPLQLLAPAIEAYDKVLQALPLPSPDGAADKTIDYVNALGERAASALTGPLTRLFDGGGSGTSGGASSTGTGTSGTTGSTGATTGGTSSSGTAGGGATGATGAPAFTATSGAVPPENLRPGDIIRFLGYIPGKLREALAALEAGKLGQVLAGIDRVSRGLARDLRAVRDALWSVDARLHGDLGAMLTPLAHHQATAQLAVRAHFQPGEVDLAAADRGLALAGPAALRLELAAPLRLARDAATATSASLIHQVGTELNRTADALDRCLLSRLVTDADGLLAALDPEPIAVEIDGFVGVVLDKAPQIIAQVGEALNTAVTRVRDLLNTFNPGAQAQKFLAVLDVIREQFDALSPRRLAIELTEIHAAIRGTVSAFDPGPFVTELSETVNAVATAVRALDPATLLGEVTFLKDAVAKIEAALPTVALEGIGTQLTALGDQLADVDLDGLLQSVKQLGPEIVEQSEKAAAALQQEVLALLESLRYAGGGASAEVQVNT